MMERRDYTNPWADKLQEVPLPDANDSWNAMAVLLDKEMPLPGRPNRRRWLLLVLLLLLLIGVCNCPRLSRWHPGRASRSLPSIPATTPPPAGKTSSAPAPSASAPASSASGPNASVSPDQPAGTSTPPVSYTPSGKDSLSGSGTSGGETPGLKAGRPAATDTLTSSTLRSPTTISSALRSGARRHPHRKIRSGMTGSNTAGPGTLSPATTASNTGPPNASSAKTPGIAWSGSHKVRPSRSDARRPGLKTARPNATGIFSTLRSPTLRTPTTTSSTRRSPTTTSSALRSGARRHPHRKIRSGTNGSNTAGPGTLSPATTASNTITPNSPSSPTPGVTGAGDHKAGAPPTGGTTDTVSRKADSSATVAKKSSTGNKGEGKKKPVVVPDNKKTPPADTTQEDPVRGLVAGIGFNQFFTVGQQQQSNYNSGGTSGGLGDYLPVPMIRYYFNKKLYVQLEAQFNTPQYTKNNLIASQSPGDTLSPGRIQQSSVTIKKLFYFNLPLSIHYSPIKNLYLGTGLQYSRLSNGVGLFQDKVLIVGGNDSVKAVKIQSFKGDSTYRKIRTNELRFLLDINYTYKRFIVGARYNQALSKFLDVRISNTQVTQARNSSLQVYLRYILWNNRKKKPVRSR